MKYINENIIGIRNSDHTYLILIKLDDDDNIIINSDLYEFLLIFYLSN